jgi:hypothetical protein
MHLSLFGLLVGGSMDTTKTPLLCFFGTFYHSFQLLNYFYVIRRVQLGYLKYIYLAQKRLKLCEKSIKNNSLAQLSH